MRGVIKLSLQRVIHEGHEAYVSWNAGPQILMSLNHATEQVSCFSKDKVLGQA